MDKQINILNAVINTLNQINVSGKQNLDRLLGSITALEMVVKELNVQGDKPEGEDTHE